MSIVTTHSAYICLPFLGESYAERYFTGRGRYFFDTDLDLSERYADGSDGITVFIGRWAVTMDPARIESAQTCGARLFWKPHQWLRFAAPVLLATVVVKAVLAGAWWRAGAMFGPRWA